MQYDRHLHRTQSAEAGPLLHPLRGAGMYLPYGTRIDIPHGL